MKTPPIDFESELQRGRKSYNEKVGRWWYRQSENNPHKKAYKKIARCAEEFAPKKPGVIIDYACGGGQLLTRLYKRFPKSEIIGIDGSSWMLEIVEKRLQKIGGNFDKRVLLVESFLPNFELDLPRADILVFAFPNIAVRAKDQPYYDENGFEHPGDQKVARFLAEAREEDPDEETVFDEPDELWDSLLTCKVISRNLRGLLKKGGICIRAEYSNARRDELSRLVEMRQAFEEGSLGKIGQGFKAEKIFKLLDSRYYRSKVIEDVYHQTRDELDSVGGYFINILKAV